MLAKDRCDIIVIGAKKIVIAAALLLAIAVPAGAGDLGVVLMTGKQGTNGAKSPTAAVAKALEQAGFLVDAPEVPWTRDRYLAKDYEDSMAEIDQAVGRLKAKGATKIVGGGQSMGANAALGYGARRDGLAGILALSPGHVVETPEVLALFAASVARAREMVAAGKGDDKAEFEDNNQGKHFKITIPARIYLSWFAPDGPAIFPKNAAALKPGTPLLWMFGEEDIMRKRGEGYAFAKVPPHPNSAYVVVPGGHFDSASASAERVVAWVKALD